MCWQMRTRRKHWVSATLTPLSPIFFTLRFLLLTKSYSRLYSSLGITAIQLPYHICFTNIRVSLSLTHTYIHTNRTRHFMPKQFKDTASNMANTAIAVWSFRSPQISCGSQFPSLSPFHYRQCLESSENIYTFYAEVGLTAGDFNPEHCLN